MIGRVKGLLVGLWVPAHFAYSTGHFRSSLARKAVDRHGNTVPWYAFPAVEYLSRIDFADADVLEFGGGQSTLWWARRARSVTTVEEDPAWRQRISADAPGNVKVLAAPAGLDQTDRYDVVVVDGGERIGNTRTALALLKREGMIVFDNSDGDWFEGPAEWFREAGMGRIDFYGYAAGVRRSQVTSVAFTAEARFLRNVRRPPTPTRPG